MRQITANKGDGNQGRIDYDALNEIEVKLKKKIEDLDLKFSN
jgi:hypothetical protein